MNDVYRLSIIFFVFIDKKGEFHSTKEQNQKQQGGQSQE